GRDRIGGATRYVVPGRSHPIAVRLGSTASRPDASSFRRSHRVPPIAGSASFATEVWRDF
ncbi:MAG TPA: hypothetical protein VL068_02365, partial [Microthrixaceae bacterium]|nr:hypothetical protein [Microthrixaceae bacterium]